MLLRSLRPPSPPLPWIPSRPSLPSSLLSLPSSSTPPAAIRAALDGGASRAPPERDREVEDGGPTSVPLEVIDGEVGFDRIVAEQEEGRTVVVLWMANWCRKCIYLKPKLEKLAATYYPGVRFYCVDVNSVPQRLVSRAGVTKMPTIQLWRDGKKQGEVIGGHKAWLVVNEVQQMLDNED